MYYGRFVWTSESYVRGESYFLHIAFGKEPQTLDQRSTFVGHSCFNQRYCCAFVKNMHLLYGQ